MSMRRGRKRRTLLFEVYFYRNQRAELICTVSQFCRVIIDCLCVEIIIYHIKEMSVYSRLCKHTSKTVKDVKTGLLALMIYCIGFEMSIFVSLGKIYMYT